MIPLSAEKTCCIASLVNKTPTPAVLKEALETVSEIELLPHLGSFTISLAIFFARLIPNSHDFVSLYNQQTSGTDEDLPTTSTEIKNKGCGTA